MLPSFLRRWRNPCPGKPGHRFRARYERNRKREGSSRWLPRLLRLLLALLCLVVAVVLTFIPGPAIVFFLLAGALIATDSRRMADVLDRSEVRLRRLAGVARRWWKSLGGAGRAAILAGTFVLTIASGYFAYQFIT